MQGYVAKLYLDQSWLAQETSDWKVAITFANEVYEFKVGTRLTFLYLRHSILFIGVGCRHRQPSHKKQLCDERDERGNHEQVLQSHPVLLPVP